jgi:hypothetical protein
MLKSGNQEEITKMFRSMEGEAKAIVSNVIQLVYFMRGSIQYDDMMYRTPGERDLIERFISDRMEQEKDHMYPQY